MRRGVDDGDAWRLIKIVFWEYFFCLGIRQSDPLPEKRVMIVQFLRQNWRSAV